MSRSRTVRLLAATLAVLGVVALTDASPASARTWLPVPYSLAAAVIAGNTAPSTPPPGANDWSCRPSAAHPRPVVLVHGALANERLNWDSLSPLLYDNGYCVFTFNYGSNDIDPVNDGLTAIEGSAAQLRDFVDRVLAATGVAQVDIVGHSQGGMMPRYYLKFLGGAAKVHTLVGIAPSNHGSTMMGIATLISYLAAAGVGAPLDLATVLCTACTQQYAGSSFNTNLDAGGDTVPGVQYTVIASKTDEITTPYTIDFLSGPSVTNITVQNGCPIDLTGHVNIVFDPRALALVVNALDPSHPQLVPCLPEPFAG